MNVNKSIHEIIYIYVYTDTIGGCQESTARAQVSESPQQKLTSVAVAVRACKGAAARVKLVFYWWVFLLVAGTLPP